MKDNPKRMCDVRESFKDMLKFYGVPERNIEEVKDVLSGEVMRASEYWREDDSKIKEIQSYFAAQLDPLHCYDLKTVLELIRQGIDKFIEDFFHTYSHEEMVNSR